MHFKAANKSKLRTIRKNNKINNERKKQEANKKDLFFFPKQKCFYNFRSLSCLVSLTHMRQQRTKKKVGKEKKKVFGEMKGKRDLVKRNLRERRKSDFYKTLFCSVNRF